MTSIVKNGIRSKERVRDLAEVMTPANIVKDMIALIPDHKWADPTFTVLEPSCGSGNFVVAVVNKKIKMCKMRTQLETVITALNTTWAVDISTTNVIETRVRLLDILFDNIFNCKARSLTRIKAALFGTAIIRHNISKVNDTLQNLQQLNAKKFIYRTKGLKHKDVIPISKQDALLSFIQMMGILIKKDRNHAENLCLWL